MKSSLVRQKFLDFFRERGHEIVVSAPMVVKDDPTLMFTNAGMNQFKDIFLDNAPVKYQRIADTQKCLRVSGKHNDLEEVGQKQSCDFVGRCNAFAPKRMASYASYYYSIKHTPA